MTPRQCVFTGTYFIQLFVGGGGGGGVKPQEKVIYKLCVMLEGFEAPM